MTKKQHENDQPEGYAAGSTQGETQGVPLGADGQGAHTQGAERNPPVFSEDVIPLASLPAEVKAQMKGVENAELEEKVLLVVQHLGGIANVDKLIPALYRHREVIITREALMRRAKSMVHQGHLVRIGTRSHGGTYQLTERGVAYANAIKNSEAQAS